MATLSSRPSVSPYAFFFRSSQPCVCAPPPCDLGTCGDLHMAAQMDAGGAAVVGHGMQVVIEDIQIHHHAGSREVFLGKVLEILARDARLDFFVPGGACERARRGRAETAQCGGTQKTPTGSHRKILPRLGQLRQHPPPLLFGAALSGQARIFALGSRRLKAGGSQDLAAPLFLTQHYYPAALFPAAARSAAGAPNNLLPAIPAAPSDA